MTTKHFRYLIVMILTSVTIAGCAGSTSTPSSSGGAVINDEAGVDAQPTPGENGDMKLPPPPPPRPAPPL